MIKLNSANKEGINLKFFEKIFDYKIERFNTYKILKLKFFGISFRTRFHNKINTDINKKELLDFLYSSDNKNFVKITKRPYERKPEDTKLIAFYLPQFHTIPLNDKYIERGFTEWTNVTKTMPQFIGHYQPHLPVDVGFYDLTTDKVMYRQIELAKMYGIYGFCFHYYWFSGGKRLLETPLFNFLRNKELDIPFALCWANESWAKQWDGGNKEVMMEQKFSYEDCDKFFFDVLPFLKDKRYIKINNKPLFVIYNPGLFKREETTYFVKRLRELAKENGFADLYILGAKVFGNTDSTVYGMDASVEFYPNGHENLKEIDLTGKILNKNFMSKVFDMEDAIKNKKFMPEVNYPLYKTVFPYWDNSARKAFQGGWVFQTTPDLYKQWLLDAIIWTKKNHSAEEQFVFINAWNEWAEGAHLEPDRKFGYAFLEATKNCLNNE